MEAYDKNFSGQLPLWDLLFGTAIMEERTSPQKYGVDDPVPTTFLASLSYPFMMQNASKANGAGTFDSPIEQTVRD